MTYPIIALLCNPTPALESGHISQAGIVPSSFPHVALLRTRIATQQFCIAIDESLVGKVLGCEVAVIILSAPCYDEIPRFQHPIDHEDNSSTT